MMHGDFDGFSPELFRFLEELSEHNDRDWFHANKERYERQVQGPALEFIGAMAPRLGRISSSFVADPRKVGGSLMRVYRDTRFSHDKTPYKTNVGIQFRHMLGKDVHAPGFYVHLEPEQCFLGVGLWHPEPPALAKIRARVDEEADRWTALRDAPSFRGTWRLTGESAKTAPRGYAKDHPLIEDLKRKDFIAGREISREEVLSPRFIDDVAESFTVAGPFMRFLCEAVEVPF